MRQTLFNTLQSGLLKTEIFTNPRTKAPSTLTAAYKNILHHSTHTLTPAQRDKNEDYANRDQRAADVVFVLGPGMDDGKIKSMENECKKNGLKFLLIGDGRDPIPLVGMGKKLNCEVNK